MSVKVWNKLTKHLQNFLSSRMEESDVEGLMDDWKDEKNEVLKFLNVTETKKVKDPNAPKKPLSSYICFCNDTRDTVTSQHPDMKAVDVTRELGKRWKKLTEKQREKYNKLSAKDKARYEEEMKNYTPPDPSELVSTQRRKKKERTGPKRPTTSFFFYCARERPLLKEEFPEMKAIEVTKLLGQKWRELPDEEKQLFVDLATKDKERYARECEDAGLQTKSKAETKTETKTKPKQPKKAPEEKKSKAPRKKGKTGYNLFCQETRPEIKEENPTWKNPQVTKELSKRWKALSDEEHDEWNERAAGESVAK